MDYIWRHGALDIQVPAPVGSNRNMDNWQQNSGDATIPLDALPFNSIFRHLHCFAVSSPSCAFFLLYMASECLMHHASKCSPYPVTSLCIHWLNIVHPIIFTVHDRTSNLDFCIFPKCGAYKFLSYGASFSHILVNLSLSCFLRLTILQNKVWHIFEGTSP